MQQLPAVISGLATLLVGCAHWHYERNAPGHIDVLQPPAAMACEAQEWPRDPGENVIELFPTVYLGGGVVGLTSKDGWAAAAIGAEASFLYGSFEGSHADDEFVIRAPRDGLGLNLGIYGFSREDRLMAYGEVLLRHVVLNISPGWAWNLETSRHGPQLTLSGMLLYLRATHLLGSHTDQSAGIYLDGVLAWFWSR
jgi:hypothetical protein